MTEIEQSKKIAIKSLELRVQ